MDLDLRKLRYFQAVATELHFGRAAEALHVAQPVLSRQIRALENDLRVQLLARDQRGTQLTAAGEQLLADVGRSSRRPKPFANGSAERLAASDSSSASSPG